MVLAFSLKASQTFESVPSPLESGATQPFNNQRRELVNVQDAATPTGTFCYVI
jgi:hypothetical protein